MTSEVVLGVFVDRGAAEGALLELKNEGYEPEQISVITHDESLDIGEQNKGGKAGKGAKAGAATGAISGGIAGLAIGLSAIAVPGAGAVLIGGPIAAALGLTGAAAATATGTITGALSGGLLGALVGLGLPEKEAEKYEKKIKEGGIFIAVPTRARNDMAAIDILLEYGGRDVKAVPVSPSREYFSQDPWRTEAEA